MVKTALILALVLALPASLLAVAWATRKSRRAASGAKGTFRRAMAAQIVVFAAIYGGMLCWAADSAWGRAPEPLKDEAAAAAESKRQGGLGVGDGLGMLAVALATGLSVLAAGYAVAVVGSAALGAIAEKPELFGRSLILVGLAEGLAIYGLIVSILILGRLG